MDRFFAWVEARWSPYNLVFGTGGVLSGVLGGLATWATEAFAAKAPASWVAAGFGASLAFSLIVAAISWARAQIAKANLLRETAKTPSQVNPLEPQFDSKRIDLHSFVAPLYLPVSEKIFTRCELVGPATIMLSGSRISNSKNYPFMACDFFISSSEFRWKTDIITFQGCTFVDCRFMKCVVILMYGDPIISRLGSEYILNHDSKSIMEASKEFGHDKSKRG